MVPFTNTLTLHVLWEKNKPAHLKIVTKSVEGQMVITAQSGKRKEQQDSKQNILYLQPFGSRGATWSMHNKNATTIGCWQH